MDRDEHYAVVCHGHGPPAPTRTTKTIARELDGVDLSVSELTVGNQHKNAPFERMFYNEMPFEKSNCLHCLPSRFPIPDVRERAFLEEEVVPIVSSCILAYKFEIFAWVKHRHLNPDDIVDRSLA